TYGTNQVRADSRTRGDSPHAPGGPECYARGPDAVPLPIQSAATMLAQSSVRACVTVKGDPAAVARRTSQFAFCVLTRTRPRFHYPLLDSDGGRKLRWDTLLLLCPALPDTLLWEKANRVRDRRPTANQPIWAAGVDMTHQFVREPLRAEEADRLA